MTDTLAFQALAIYYQHWGKESYRCRLTESSALQLTSALEDVFSSSEELGYTLRFSNHHSLYQSLMLRLLRSLDYEKPTHRIPVQSERHRLMSQMKVGKHYKVFMIRNGYQPKDIRRVHAIISFM